MSEWPTARAQCVRQKQADGRIGGDCGRCVQRSGLPEVLRQHQVAALDFAGNVQEKPAVRGHG